MNRDMTDDITVFIGGSHPLYSPLEFGPEDSGSNGYSIIYTAAPDEHPVVSGAYRVSGWSLADKARNLWSAPAPAGLEDTRDLYVNSSLAERTRARLTQAISKEPGAPPPVDPRARWRDSPGVEFSGPEPDAIWSERAGTPALYVANAADLLGTPGEWFFDRAARRILYVPREGEDLATADAEVAAASSFLVGSGQPGKPLVGLVFKGIRFEFTTLHGPPAAAVQFTLAGAVQFLEDDFVHMAAPAMDLGPGFSGGVVEGCEFGDLQSTALRVAGASDVRISNCRFSYVATVNHEGCAIEIDHSAGVSVTSTQIDHYPNASILSDGRPLANGPGGSNLVSDPMIGKHGAADSAEPRNASQADAGLCAPFRSLLAETIVPRAAPRPPAVVSADPGDGFAYVTWDPPCLDGGLPVTSYTVTSSSGARMTVSASDFPAKGYVVFGNLENGSSVSFTVVASNEEGPSPPSVASAAVLPLHRRRLKVPQPPMSVSIAVNGAGSRIQLTPPSATGGSPVVAYSVAAVPSGRRVVLEGRDVIHSDAAHPLVRTIAGYQPDPADTVAVSAVNSRGEGQPAVVKPQR
ncbi:MAG TPA: hypothetical protein VII43_04280 [Opitutaceae bacterium]